MTLKTLPIFHYGFEVLEECTWVDFREYIDDVMGPEISFELKVGVYCSEEIRSMLEVAFNLVGTLNYTVAYDKFTRRYKIHADDYFELLVGTGTNSGSSLLKCLGFGSYPVYGEDHLYGDPSLDYGDVDTGLFVIHRAKFPAGFVFEPQFKIQDFIDAENNEALRAASKQESTSGEVEVLHFSTDRTYVFNFKYITNREMPCGGPIRNDPNAVESVNSFMSWAIRQKVIEYYPDKSNMETSFKIRLEKAKGNSKGLGYRLKELTSKNLPGFFETERVTFRRLD